MNVLKRLLAFPFSFRQAQAAKTRTRINKDIFADSITKDSLEHDISTEIWTIITNDYLACDNFCPMPDDDLAYLYGITEEELDEDIILMLLRKFNIPVPPEDDVKIFGKIKTPRDIVNFISFSRSLPS